MTTALGITGIAVTAKSSKLSQQVENLPSNFDTFTTNTANAIDNPSLQSFGKIYKDSPIISGGLTLAGLGLIGSSVSGTVSTIMNTAAVKKNTDVMLNTGGDVVKALIPSPSDTATKDTATVKSPQLLGNNMPSSTPQQAAMLPTNGSIVPSTKSYNTVTSSRKHSKKSKHLNISPVNVRIYNNFVAGNRIAR